MPADPRQPAHVNELGVRPVRRRSCSLDSATKIGAHPKPLFAPAHRNPRFFLSVHDHLPTHVPSKGFPMLAAPTIDLTFDSDSDWLPPSDFNSKLTRTASVGNSWGVTSFGGGYSWSKTNKSNDNRCDSSQEDERLVVKQGSFIDPVSPKETRSFEQQLADAASEASSSSRPLLNRLQDDASTHFGAFTTEPVSFESPITRSGFSSSAVSLTSLCTTPEIQSLPFSEDRSPSKRPSLSRSPSAPRPRRRSSQQRVSLIAGRLSIVSNDPPPNDNSLVPMLHRHGSQSSFLSSASTAAPTPSNEKESFLGGRSISEFVIEGELGRGAYGLVKRAREMNADGTMGVSTLIKIVLFTALLLIHFIKASSHYKRNHQVAHSSRLLEKTSKIWHYPYRDLCNVFNFFNIICFTTKASLGPISNVYLIRRGSRPVDHG